MPLPLRSRAPRRGRSIGLAIAFALLGCGSSAETGAPRPTPTPDGGSPGADDAGSSSLHASTSAQDFGSLTVGSSSAPTNVLVTNEGTAPTGALAVSLGGADAADFAIDSDACSGKTLAPLASCAVTLHFTPPAAGADSASLAIAATPGGSVAVALRGTGIAPGALAITPPTSDFGAVPPGQTSTAQTFTVTNTGGESTGSLASALSGTDAAEFTITRDGCAVPFLAPGKSCTLSVAFAPTAPGTEAASLTVTGAPGGTAAAALSGTAPSPAAITLTATKTAFPLTLVNAQSAPLTVTVTNTGGIAAGTVTFGAIGQNAYDFSVSSTTCAGPIPGGGSCTADVTFSPQHTGTETAELTATAGPGGFATLDVSGTGGTAPLLEGGYAQGPLTCPAGLATGDIFVNVENAGTEPTGVLTWSLSNWPDEGGFVIDPAQTTCVASAPFAGASDCVIAVSFAPTSATEYEGTLQVSASPGGSFTTTLTGTATTLTLTTSASSLTFPPTSVGQTSATQTLIVFNPGSSATQDDFSVAITGSGASSFEIVSDTCDGAPMPAFAPCTLTVAFKPTAAGDAPATLTAGAGAGIPTVSVTLDGTGE